MHCSGKRVTRANPALKRSGQQRRYACGCPPLSSALSPNLTGFNRCPAEEASHEISVAAECTAVCDHSACVLTYGTAVKARGGKIVRMAHKSPDWFGFGRRAK